MFTNSCALGWPQIAPTRQGEIFLLLLPVTNVPRKVANALQKWGKLHAPMPSDAAIEPSNIPQRFQWNCPVALQWAGKKWSLGISLAITPWTPKIELTASVNRKWRNWLHFPASHSIAVKTSVQWVPRVNGQMLVGRKYQLQMTINRQLEMEMN